MGLLMLLVEIVGFCILAGLGYVFYIEHKHKAYFQRWGVPYMGAGLGNILRFITGRVSLFDLEFLMYNESKKTGSPFTGFTDAFTNPGVYIADLDLARNIFVKDFDHFVNRRNFAGQKGDQLFHKMIIMMENEHWKGMRSKLSPSFTTGKIRRMFDIFEGSSGKMCDYLRKRVGPSGGDYDVTDVYSKYAMDVIASCVFGVDSKTYENEPGQLTKFEEMGVLLQFNFKVSTFIKVMFTLAAPKLADMLGVEAFDPTPQRYFKQVIQQVMKHRRETGERKEDFLQLMMDIQKGLLKEEDSKELLEVMTGSSEEGKSWSEASNKFDKFDDDDIAANSILFLLAGFDTLQSLLIYTAYALALEQDVQGKLLEEIKESMEANGGKLTYDGIHQMKYLDLVINETLRYYPPAGRTERMCLKDYRVPGTNAVIEKGVIVSLPILAVHRDPEHYPNPDKFEPERFLPERKAERHPYAFQAFGHGPRNCIGMRFALTEVKAVICSLVRNFQLEPCAKTEIPPKPANNTTLKPLNGMWLRVQPRSE